MTTHRPISVLDALKSKIESCWTRPKGRQQVGQISPITVTLTFNRDGSLASGPVVNNPNHGPMGAKLERVITQDLKRCAPYRIVKDNPDLYKIVNPLELTFHFDQRP